MSLPPRRRCPNCKSIHPENVAICACGQVVTQEPLLGSDQEFKPAGKPRVVFSLLFGFVFAAIALVFVTFQITGAGSVRNQCVAAYSTSTRTVEFPGPDQVNRLATLLEGTVRNDCGKPLKAFSLVIKMRDQEGKTTSGVYVVDGLAVGESKPFEAAWLGRLSDFEITPTR